MSKDKQYLQKNRCKNKTYNNFSYNHEITLFLGRKNMGMNGDQETVRNNEFPNVPKKNHHS